MKKPFNAEAQIWQMAQDTQKMMEYAAELREKQGLPFVTALIVAGDMVSADKANRLVEIGVPPESAVLTVGSFSRFDWAVQNRKYFGEEFWLANICELWRDSDPDDANPEYLELWRLCRAANATILRDVPSERFPIQIGERLRVYRGQRIDDPIGISWTTSRDVARNFATGAAYRVLVPGLIFSTYVFWEDCLAYITERGEYEVIVDVEAAGLVKRLGDKAMKPTALFQVMEPGDV